MGKTRLRWGLPLSVGGTELELMLLGGMTTRPTIMQKLAGLVEAGLLRTGLGTAQAVCQGRDTVGAEEPTRAMAAAAEVLGPPLLGGLLAPERVAQLQGFQWFMPWVARAVLVAPPEQLREVLPRLRAQGAAVRHRQVVRDRVDAQVWWFFVMTCVRRPLPVCLCQAAMARRV